MRIRRIGWLKNGNNEGLEVMEKVRIERLVEDDTEGWDGWRKVTLRD